VVWDWRDAQGPLLHAISHIKCASACTDKYTHTRTRLHPTSLLADLTCFGCTAFALPSGMPHILHTRTAFYPAGSYSEDGLCTIIPPPPSPRGACGRSVAGLLRTEAPAFRQPGRMRSGLLLLGRLLIAILLVYAGAAQLERMHHTAEARQLGITPSHHYGLPDAHDNSWQLVECALALPVVLGLATRPVALALAGALMAEGVTCWHWWWPPPGGWPSWSYAQHVREHFFVNAAVAGGLLLLQSFGPGMISVDHLWKEE